MGDPRSRLRETWDDLCLTPFQAMIGVAMMIAGGATLLGVAPPSLHDSLPRPLIVGWASILLVGSPLMLAGLIARAPRLEQAGLVLLTAATAIYGIAISVVQPAAATAVAATYLLLAVACLMRIRILNRAIDAGRLALEHHDRD